MTENPYASPTTTSSQDSLSAIDPSNPSLMAIARHVFIAWEKLRIVYILILGTVTVLITLALIGLTGAFQFRLLPLVIAGAVAANIAFFAGPIVETYIRWLGYNRAWPRWFMFCSGTLLSTFLAIGAIASEMIPSQT